MEKLALLAWLVCGGALQYENPTQLMYAASGNIAFCLKTNRLVFCASLPSPLDPIINRFSELIMEHFWV